MGGHFLDYNLPDEKIAARPVTNRSEAKLLRAIKGKTLSLQDCHFFDLPQILKKGDLVVCNQTRVLPYRFFAKQKRTGREVEILLLEKESNGKRSGADEVWLAMGRPLRKFQPGDELELSSHLLGKVMGRDVSGERVLLTLSIDESSKKTIENTITEEGLIPIPPYIRNGRSDEQDRAYYQTVFSSVKPSLSPTCLSSVLPVGLKGSLAAPTAGLHFSIELLNELRARSIELAFVTLDIGPVSFAKLELEDLDAETLPAEQYAIPAMTWRAIELAKQEKRRVVAVGTTVVRALETFVRLKHPIVDQSLTSNLFVRPGFRFQCVDALITNFHQPHSTHLLMVQAFFGKNETEKLYRYGLENAYRFLSYGDGMFLEKVKDNVNDKEDNAE